MSARAPAHGAWSTGVNPLSRKRSSSGPIRSTSRAMWCSPGPRRARWVSSTEPAPAGETSSAGPAGGAPAPEDAEVVGAHAVRPGLWDCHTHFMGLRSPDLSLLPQEPIALRAARCVSDLRAARDAGVTSAREVGGLGVHL